MFPDTHIHTNFSKDSQAAPYTQVDRCLLLGMKELCITDHHDYGSDLAGDAFLLDFDTYLPYMRRLRQTYEGRIQVNIGVELGLQLHIRDYLEKLVQNIEVDFIIGSCHFIDNKDPYFPEYFEGKSEREAYEHYFDVTLKRILNLNCFDSFGHLDYIVRYGPHTNINYSYAAYQDYIDPILKALIEKGKALECNTAGFKYNLGHPNPSEDILKRYREMGGDLITLGSDAHAPEYIGYDFEKTRSILTDCGFRYLTVYHQRKPDFIPL